MLRLEGIVFQSKIDEVFKAFWLLSVGIVERTEVGTVVFLRMKDGGKKEVLRGSLFFIHNNYKNHKNMIYFV
jgi:hypothetical protein